MKRSLAIITAMVMVLSFFALSSVFAVNNNEKHAHGMDNIKDSFTNPLLWGDYPDPDIIRVGEYYYMSSTSMQLFPGCPVMRSRDLVNWETYTYAVDGNALIAAYNPALHTGNVRSTAPMILSGGQQMYGSGPWASSLRYNNVNDKFYSLYTCNDLDTSFVSISKTNDMKDGWDIYDLGVFAYDPSLFFDDDGTGYIICQRTTHDINNDLSHPECVNLSIAKLAPDCKSVLSDPGLGSGLTSSVDSRFRRIIYTGHYSEGLRAYKKDGKYYLLHVYPDLMNAWRADSLAGPWESYKLADGGILQADANGEHYWTKQGSIVEGENGEWWSIAFEDFGSIGRRPMLMPVTWVDGWPLYGYNGDRMPVYTGALPYASNPSPEFYLNTNDNFDSNKLSLEWQFNHVPDVSGYSLTDRPGFLRMKTVTRVTGTGNAPLTKMFEVRNAMSQRIQGPFSSGTVKIDLSNMKTGDVAGLSVFQSPYSYIAARKTVAGYEIIMADNASTQTTNPDDGYFTGWRTDGGVITGPASYTGGSTIYFRAECDTYKERVNYYYSSDNYNWIKFGNEPILYYSGSVFVGARFTIFNFATTSTVGGYIDVDWFKLYSDRTGNMYTAFHKLQMQQYDQKSNIHFTDSTNKIKNGNPVIYDIDKSREQITGAYGTGYIKYDNINFFAGAESITLRARTTSPTAIDIRINSPTGPIIATVDVSSSAWTDCTAPLTAAANGRVTLYVTFRNGSASVLWLRAKPSVQEFKIGYGGKSLKTDATGTYPDENGSMYSLEQTPDGNIYIKTGGNYLYTDADGSIKAKSSVDIKSEFRMLDLYAGLGFSSVNQRLFLQIIGDEVLATADYIHQADAFTVEEIKYFPVITAANTAGGKRITITTTLAGAQIYYTTDGSIPTTSSNLYTAPFTDNTAGTKTIKARAVNAEYPNSFLTEFTYTVEKVTAPTITMDTSVVPYMIRITGESGAELRYTIDGSTPNPGTLYNKAFTGLPYGLQTIKAVANRTGYAASDITTEQVDIPLPYPSITTENILGGKRMIMSSEVVGARIYYTIDGSEPTSSSLLYVGEVDLTLPGSATIKAITTLDGYVKSYTISSNVGVTRLPIPKISTQEIESGKRITLTASAGAIIYYTTDGTTPDITSNVYTAPIDITSEVTVKAFAITFGYTSSATATLTINPGKTDEVIADIPSSAVPSGTPITLSTATSGAQIYYTTDGSTPTMSSQIYTSPIIVNGDITIKAMAAKYGYAESDVCEFNYSSFIYGKLTDSGDNVDIFDLIKLAQYLAGIETLTEKQKMAANVNGDNKVDIMDLIRLAQYLAGIDVKLGE